MLSDFERKLLRILYTSSRGHPDHLINTNMKSVMRKTGRSQADIVAAVRVLKEHGYLADSLKVPGKLMVLYGWEEKQRL